jgi:hypothetical protein
MDPDIRQGLIPLTSPMHPSLQEAGTIPRTVNEQVQFGETQTVRPLSLIIRNWVGNSHTNRIELWAPTGAIYMRKKSV